MFDINAVVNAAIKTAVDASLVQVKQEHLNAIGAMAQEIVKLQEQLATLAEKTAALAGQVQPTSEGLDLRTLIRAELLDLLVNDETVGERLNSRCVAAADQAVENHCDLYSHDDYDQAVSDLEDLEDLKDLDVDDLVKSEDLRSEVKEILEGASFSVSF